MPGELSPPLTDALEEARALGFLGPGPLDVHVRHADGFVALLRRTLPPFAAGHPAPMVADLGSGGGVPGLVIADRLPLVRMLLVEVAARRAEFLRAAVDRCGWAERVVVREERAEDLGRDPAVRGSVDAVVARSFGPPAVVAECAAPLLAAGGVLVVSEPPLAEEGRPSPSDLAPPPGSRWPAAPLAQLGLETVEAARAEFGYQLLRRSGVCPDRYPRRVGVPAKRPLF